MMKKTFLLGILALTFFCACTVKEADEASKNDHLNIDITFSGSNMVVKAEYIFQNKYAGSDSAHFVVNPGIQNIKIDAEGLVEQGVAMVPNRPFPFRKLRFNAPMAEGELVAVNFEYEINLSQMNFIDEDWLELNVDQMWFPNYNDLDNAFTSTTTIHNLYDNFTLTSCCGNEIIENADGSLRMEVKNPVPSVFIVGGKNMKYWDSDPRDLGLKFFAEVNTPDSIINSQYTKAANAIEMYNASFAQKDPLTDMTIVFRQTEKLNYLYCRTNVIVSLAIADSFTSISHELAHHWWDKASFITEAWLNESFAEYSMLLVYEKYLADKYEKKRSSYADRSGNLPAVIGTGSFSTQSYEVNYIKGVHILKSLEERIGKTTMIDLMSKRIENNINTTNGLLDALEKLTDKATKDYLKELLSN